MHIKQPKSEQKNELIASNIDYADTQSWLTIMSTVYICSILFSLFIMPPQAHLVTETKPLNTGSSFLSIIPFMISELICYLHEEDVSRSACSFLS